MGNSRKRLYIKAYKKLELLIYIKDNIWYLQRGNIDKQISLNTKNITLAKQRAITYYIELLNAVNINIKGDKKCIQKTT